MQKTHAMFPDGLWGIDHRRHNRHWSIIQCNAWNDLQKIRLLSPQSFIREGPPPNFQIMFANGQLETPKSTIELKFEVGDIEFHEIFIVMENLTRPIVGLIFFQRNHTVLDMRQGILNFPFFSMHLKTADHRYSNVLEPILNPIEVTIPPNDRVLIRTNSLLYSENAVTGILQPSDLLHEEGDITFCPALVTLNDGSISIPVNNFTDHSYKLVPAQMTFSTMVSRSTTSRSTTTRSKVLLADVTPNHMGILEWVRGPRNEEPSPSDFWNELFSHGYTSSREFLVALLFLGFWRSGNGCITSLVSDFEKCGILTAVL